MVRVSVVRGGGFGGLIRTTTADTERLSPGDGQRLAALAREAGLLDAPAPPPPEEPGPDRFSYAVTVQDGERSRTTRFSEQSLPPGVRSLISWVSTVSGRDESVGPPGGAQH